MAPLSGHVMLSYQWDTQKLVLQIKDALEKEGFKMWMDLDQMQGNIFDKMAQGVENASLIVVTMTSGYERSINCNREIQYAQVKNKKIIPIKCEKNYNPSGAFGLIIAGSLYVDFTDESRFEANIAALKKEINIALGNSEPQAAPKSVTETHHGPANHRMRVKWVEERNNTWNGAADRIINALREKNVKRRQVIAISAHNNGKEEDAIFAAFYDINDEGDGDLNLAYEFQNDTYGWSQFYQNGCHQIRGVKPEDVLSLTGCCNHRGRSVFYAFIQFPSYGSGNNPQFVESRSGSWNGAADAVVGALVARGVKQGQLLSIDAHNNGEDEDAIFSAFWDPSLPARGPLSIGYKAFNAKYGWPTFYNNVVDECNKMYRKDFISVTGSINCSDSSVMYIFYYN